ncbi:hypothetical protein LTR36_009081 [Oleoguttula mirabilis]|uniref:Uncharacterized protein n=1 Tax=Oleoguttula mirabilis TaxID=1507867 RepID=A0AAV9J830_9PEZI|nr:hypothetical protein LTR36_009081 [Oleoguttula mirabilis]
MTTGQFNVRGGQLSLQKLNTQSEASPAESFRHDSANDESSLKMQTCWEQTVCEALKIPDTYRHVAVLIVHWADYLDVDLKCGKEVKELNDLFAKRFNFHSNVLTLHDMKRPQAQLNHGITELILQHDGPCRSNLLIIYYTGHAVGVDNHALEVSGVRDPRNIAIGSVHEALASWNEAEKGLKDAEADVLMILDTCFAGNIFKGVSQDVRTFTVLAAAGRNMPTSPPGEHSFTRALIDSLQDQLDRPDPGPFTTFDLHCEIMRKRRNMSSQIFPRYAKRSSRFIKLAPLGGGRRPDEPQPPSPTRDTGHLTVRFAFQDTSTLELDALKRLANELSQGVLRSKLSINAIDWLGFKPSQNGTRVAQVARWRKAINLAVAYKRLSHAHGRKRERSIDPEDQDDPRKKHQQSSRSTLGALSPLSSGESELGSHQ